MRTATPTATGTLRAAIYNRLSRRTEKNAPNLEQQERLNTERAHQLDAEVVAVFSDYGESAFDGHERPQYLALCDLIQTGAVDYVVVTDSDRLWRDTIDQAVFLRDAAKHGVRGIVTRTSVMDPANPNDEMMTTILAAIGRWESNVKRGRILRKHEQLAQAGKISGGGTRPYGFEADRITVVPAEAEEVRRMVAAVIAGTPIRTVVADLNDREVPTVTGTPWRPFTVRRIVESWRIAGWRSHHGEPVAEGEWDAIVSRTDVEQVRNLLAVNPAPPRRDLRLLTGFLVCDCCGLKLVSRPKAGRSSYVIPQDPARGIRTHLRIDGEPLEELVVELALAVVDGESVARAAVDDRGPDDLLNQIADDRKRLAELGVMMADGTMTVEAFVAAQQRVVDRIKAAEAALTLTQLGRDDAVDMVDLRTRWDDLSTEDRRKVLAALIAEVRIGPAVRGRNRFDPDRVSITWRV